LETLLTQDGTLGLLRALGCIFFLFLRGAALSAPLRFLNRITKPLIWLQCVGVRR
jgi:hypothetical protein